MLMPAEIIQYKNNEDYRAETTMTHFCGNYKCQWVNNLFLKMETHKQQHKNQFLLSLNNFLIKFFDNSSSWRALFAKLYV